MPANSALRDLALKVHELDRRVRAKGSTSQLANSSIENGALRAYSDVFGEVMSIGLQWDGTYAPTVTNGPTPPTPSDPQIVDATEGIVVGWDGSFAGGLIPTPMDFLRVDVHVGAIDTFIPDHDNRRGTFSAPQGGFATIALPFGTYYVKLVMWTFAGKVSAATNAIVAHSFPVEVSTDGLAPSSSPAVEVIGGMDLLVAKWTPITNADPVRYEVHISATTGFTPDSTTLAGTTTSSQFSIKLLPGSPPVNPGDPDLRKLVYGVDYFVKLVARDDDGAAAPGAQGSAQIFQVTGVNLAADSVTAAQVVAGTLTGDLFAASVVISGAFKTAETGQRVEMTPLGFFAYKADGSVMLSIPTDSPNALYDGELIVRGATILGGMSIQSDENELTADAVLTLMRGIVSPTSTPQFAANVYDTTTFSSASLSAAQKTNTDPSWGLGGPFDFAANEVSTIEWRASLSAWAVYQVRANGTRCWYFNTDGTPHDVTGAGVYYNDFKDWEIWSGTEISGSSTPSQNGHYVMFRFMPSGTQYYVSAPTGIFKYSRQNGTQPPAIGNNGQNMFVAEVITTNHLSIRYYVPVSGTNMPAPTTAYESTTGFSTGLGLANVQYNAAGFDVSGGTGGRYLTAERGVGNKARIVLTSGTNANSIFPSGTSNNWASSAIDIHTFEAPTSNRRSTAWDGTNFYTLASDGKLYKHTGDFWDPAASSSKFWGQVTFRDSDAAGTGTHETTPGTATSFTQNRRAKFRFTSPNVPDNGGADDPNAVRLYMGRGATQPANAAMYQQYEGTGIVTMTALTTATANPPTVNSFPAANPAKIQSDDGVMQIKGDGTILFGALSVGAEITRLQSGRSMHIRTSGGSANFVKPTSPAARLHWVRIWGPGGAGGGTIGAGSGTSEGGGGGAGAYVEKWYLDSELSSTEPYVVGSGGAGVSGGAGNAGSAATTFKGLSAGPGTGGAVMTSQTGTTGAAPGFGGAGTGGDLNCNGGDGGFGRLITGNAIFGNWGGASPSGGGQTQQTDFGAGAGTAGSSPGGGGSGSFSSNTSFAGGAGAAGKIEIVSFF